MEVPANIGTSGKSREFGHICCREFVQLAAMADKSRYAEFRKSIINKLLTGDVNYVMQQPRSLRVAMFFLCEKIPSQILR